MPEGTRPRRESNPATPSSTAIRGLGRHRRRPRRASCSLLGRVLDELVVLNAQVAVLSDAVVAGVPEEAVLGRANMRLTRRPCGLSIVALNQPSSVFVMSACPYVR